MQEKWDEACKYIDRYINEYADYEKEACEMYQAVLTNLWNFCNKMKEYYAVIVYANKGIKVNKNCQNYFISVQSQMLKFLNLKMQKKYIISGKIINW